MRKQLSDLEKSVFKSSLGRDDIDRDDVKNWITGIQQGLGEVVGNDVMAWTEQYRHWDRTYQMIRVNGVLTGHVDMTEEKMRAVMMAARYRNLIGPDACDRVMHEVSSEVRQYAGEELFRKLSEGGDGDIEEMIRHKLIKDSAARMKAKKDLRYRRRKLFDASQRDRAIEYLRAEPGSIFVDADGDKWHWDGFRRLDQSGPLPDLILTLRTRHHGVSSDRNEWIPRPDGWVRPVGLD